MSKTINTDRVAIVSGGNSGLGKACVEHLINENWRVVIFDINDSDSEIEKLNAEVAQNRVIFEKVDVTSQDSIRHALNAVQSTFSNIRLCVNCAGVAPAKRTLDKSGNAYDIELFSRVININLVGSFNVAKEVASLMAKNEPDEQQQRGVIVNTASVAGYEGQIGQTAYAASKGGIIGLTLPMARDLAASGIRVNTIAPGVMGTPMLLAMPEHVQDALSSNVPNPSRLGHPNEFASLVSHIAENAYINGETIRLDGALRMPPK